MFGHGEKDCGEDGGNRETESGKLLSSLDEDDELCRINDWKAPLEAGIPADRVFLFPGAQAPCKDDQSELTYREVAHCDGCSKRIAGTILKCSVCFDYDLCQKCYPALSKTHYSGTHEFATEIACPVVDAVE